MTKRRQGKAAIATGGIDSAKTDVSDKKEQTFHERVGRHEWVGRHDIGRTFNIIDMEAAWHAGRSAVK